MSHDQTQGTIIRVRRELAELCAGLAVPELERMFGTAAGANYRALLQRLVVEVPTQKQERIYARKLRDRVGGSGHGAFGHLMAAMLYARPYDLPLLTELERIPPWFLDTFLRYRTNPALLFREAGEEDRYFDYMVKWISHLHANICAGTPSSFWQQVANTFVGISDFGPLYFSERNLRDLYAMRGDIIEQVLRWRGCNVDHTFTQRADVERGKIRIGILANHFLPHPETFAALPVYEFLGPDFEVIRYALNPAGAETQRSCPGRAVALTGLPRNLNDQVATIRADNLDILFIASNITAVIGPLCLLATHRLARLQVAGVGSVTSTGLRNVDYYLTGRLTDAESNTAHYRERLAWLPGPAHCFSFPESAEEKPVPITREALGIPADAVVYVSGANLFKILPQLMEAWAKILKGSPDTVLMLYPYGPNWSTNYPKRDFVTHIQQVFSTHKISPERLFVLDPQPVPSRVQIQEYVRVADIYLDSFPFSGTTTLIDPLSLGMPVVTRDGETFRSKMGSALLWAIGVPQLIGKDAAAYVEIAIELGRNAAWRAQLVEEISARMRKSPAFLDSRRYSETAGGIFRQLLGP